MHYQASGDAEMSLYCKNSQVLTHKVKAGSFDAHLFRMIAVSWCISHVAHRQSDILSGIAFSEVPGKRGRRIGKRSTELQLAKQLPRCSVFEDFLQDDVPAGAV